MRLGDYDENGNMCDYGTTNCTHYQEFGVEKVIPHSGYNETTNDIGLIRLDREIQFGTKVKPICLPFGSNRVPQPRVNNKFVVVGWHYGERIKSCFKATVHGGNIVINKSQICVPSEKARHGNFGDQLMKQLDEQRVVLEGIGSDSVCLFCLCLGVYTRVSSYRRWLDQNMDMS